jgi:hypothetical protein
MIEYVAIDPLALILPTSVYLAIQEKINPHVPVTSVLNEVLGNVSQEQRAFIQARVATLNLFTTAVTQALGAQAAAARG